MDKATADSEFILPALLGFLVCFGALENGAHDVWAATIVYLAVLGLGLAVLFSESRRRGSPGVSASFAAPLGGLALALAFSFALAVNPGESFLGLLDWLAAMLGFWAALHVFESDRALDRLLAFMPPFFLLEFLIGLGQRAEGGHFFMEVPPGTLGNGNLTAAFLILWIPVFIERTLRARRGGAPWRYWAAGSALNLAAFFSTYTLWGFFCLTLGVVLWFGARLGRRWLKGHIRLACGAGAGALALLAGLAWWKLNRAYNWEGHPIPSGTQTSRLLWWASGLRMFGEFPWLGVGIGNYPSAYLAFKVGAGQHSLFAHSLPVSLLAETGILGCAAFILFLGFWASRLLMDWEKAGPRWPFMAGAALFLAFGTISLSGEYLINLLLFWLFMGIAAAPCRKEAWKPGAAALAAAAMLCAAAIPYIVAPFLASRNCVFAEVRLAAGEFQAALDAFASAAAMDPRSYEAQHGCARALYARGDLEGAVIHQRKAVGLNRLRGPLWRELGDYLRLQGKGEEASRSYRQARGLNTRVNEE